MKTALRIRAAENGRSMEEETHVILREALATTPSPYDHVPLEDMSLDAAMRAIFEPLGGVELDLPPRDHGRDPPDFSE